MAKSDSIALLPIYARARASLQQTRAWYTHTRRHWNYPPDAALQNAVRPELKTLEESSKKLEQPTLIIATFGLVSRGKSAVINALLGQDILPTGPLHGVTRWPKSVHWSSPKGDWQLELIDTPGLDEIEGQEQARMAKTVASQADLILFVVAGDLTGTEYQALVQLRHSRKPLLLVFNKIDLYPDTDQALILQQLQRLGSETLNPPLQTEDIVLVAAAPQPYPVRQEWEDGQIRESWETPPPLIEPLKQKIQMLLEREGSALLAFNALTQAQKATQAIADKTVELRQGQAQKIINRYGRAKAIAVSVNPIAGLDLMGGIIADLLLIRELARLFGLPITRFEAGRLWQKFLLSSGGLLLTEMGRAVTWSLVKSSWLVLGGFENPGLAGYLLSSALTQGAIATYGTHEVGKQAQAYLARGATWGNLGPQTVMQEILKSLPANSLLRRLHSDP
ncbi:MAG: DUF697 domain-containing protein [Cyanobacteria bacterium P01_H01_bin.15]